MRREIVSAQNVRRAVIAVLAAVLAGGGVLVASAATLGGIDTDQFGADAAVVAACDDNGVDVEYTNTYDATAQEYIVEEVIVKDLATGCLGLEMKLTLIDAVDLTLWIGTVAVTGASVTIDVPTTPAVGSADVHKVAILIAG